MVNRLWTYDNPKSDFANLPMGELRRFYDIGLEKIRLTNVKRRHNMLIKALFKFIMILFKLI